MRGEVLVWHMERSDWLPYMQQAFRRLLCELLLECKVRPELALPAYAAASDAWPSGLPPATASDAAKLWSAASDTGGRDHSTCGVALLHSIAYKLSHSMHSRCQIRRLSCYRAVCMNPTLIFLCLLLVEPIVLFAVVNVTVCVTYVGRRVPKIGKKGRR